MKKRKNYSFSVAIDGNLLLLQVLEQLGAKLIAKQYNLKYTWIQVKLYRFMWQT